MSTPAASAPARAAGAPLSFQQEHVWRSPSCGSHTIPAIVLRLTGALDPHAIERALTAVIARHASLRTRVAADESGLPRQFVSPDAHVPVPVTDLDDLPVDAREDRVRELVAEANRPFDLAQEPLIRAGVIRWPGCEQALFFTMHHIVADLWSTKVLVHDLGEAYNAVIDGRDARFEPMPLQYADYALWQRARFQGERAREEARYWRGRLEGVPSLDLAAGRSAAATPLECRLDTAPLPEDVSAAVHRISRSCRSTTFATLLAGFYLLAYRRTRQPVFLVDSLVANRDRAELESMIGIFAASLPLRAVLRDVLTFEAVVRHTQDDCLDATAHQHLPFRQIQELTQRRGAMSLTRPRVCFAFQAAPFRSPELRGATIGAFDTVSTFTPTWDQWWQVVRRGSRLEVAIVYNAHLFAPAEIGALRSDYVSMLRTATSRPQAPIADLLRAA